MKLFTSTKVFLLLALLAANLIPSQSLFGQCIGQNCCKDCGADGVLNLTRRSGCGTGSGCYVTECYDQWSQGQGCAGQGNFNDSCLRGQTAINIQRLCFDER